MTDTGHFPERGQLDQTGGPPAPPEPGHHPGVPVYPYSATDGAAADDADDEDLLMPGSHGAWREPAAPAAPAAAGPPVAAPGGLGAPVVSGQPAAPGVVQAPDPASPHLPPPTHAPPPTSHPTPQHGVPTTPEARADDPSRPEPAGGATPQQPDVAGYPATPVAPPGHGVLPTRPGAWQQPPTDQPSPGAAVPGPVSPAVPTAPAPPPGAEPADREATAPVTAPVGPHPAAEGEYASGTGPNPRTGPAPPVGPDQPAVTEPTAARPATPEPATSEQESTSGQVAVPPRGDGPGATEWEPNAPGTPPDAGDRTAPVTLPSPREELGTAPPNAGDEPPGRESEREAVHRLMHEHVDTPQGFRPDAVPQEMLLRVLEAAHTAPVVGHAQPWDFVIIRSPETRRTVHDLAARQRGTHTATLSRAQARQVQGPPAAAVLDAPVNIVVTADPTRGGQAPHVPESRPEHAPYSAALAVENLWLAARAEGLAVGWVGFLDERELVTALGLPEHLEVVAYLCLGYATDTAGTDQSGAATSARRPLSWVVHEESYGRRALPGTEPHDLLGETLGRIRPLDAQALGEAWERQRRMTKPTGALGALEIISAQLCGLTRSCPPPLPEPAALAVFAGDHGVHAQGVTTWPQEVTAQMVANFLGGGAVCNAFAAQVGAEVCVIDVGVRGELPATSGLMPRRIRSGTADFTTGPALTREEVTRALEVGIETARDLVAAGHRALLTGEMGVANTTVSAALIAAFTGAEPAEVTGRGSGVDDETYARKVAVVRAALDLHRPDPADPLAVLEAVGGLEHAALTGLILGGASLRVPVILDGVTGGAAALAARAIAPESVSACVAGHRSAEPGHVAGLTALGLRPLVDLDLRLGEGTGALLALPVVQAAARSLREVATFDSAGITDKN